jgi:hypothetical protein
MFEFGAAREFAGHLARNDMVLQLDASDEVLRLDVARLHTILDRSRPSRVEYALQLGGVRLRVTRFHDRRIHEWRGRVHEVLCPRPLSPPVAHSAFVACDERTLSVRHHKDERKARNYVPGLALDVLECPGEPRWRHYLGRELLYRKWY